MGRISARPRRIILVLALTAVWCAGAGKSPATPGAARPVEAVSASEDGVRLELARKWTEKGEYDKAVQELRLYLSEHPDQPEIYSRIGYLRLKQGNFRLAGENFKIALAKRPESAEAREGLATAYEKAGDKDKALEEWRRLRESAKDPEQKKKLAAKVRELEGGAPPAEAVAAAPAAGEAKPAPAAAPHKPAAPATTASAPAPAREAGYSPGLDADGAPAASGGIYDRKDFQEAMRLYLEGKPDAALAPLRTCLTQSPGHAGAYYLGGVIRYEKGDLAKAEFNFKRSSAYPGRGHNAQFYLGRIYQKQGKNPEAIAAYEKYLQAARSEPGRKQAQAYLAQLRPGEHEPERVSEHASDHAPGHAAPEHEPKPAAAPRPSYPAAPPLLAGSGDFLFIIPDTASAAGRKLTQAYEACQREKFEKAMTLLKEAMLAYGGSENAQAAALDLASVYVRLGLWDNARDQVLEYLREPGAAGTGGPGPEKFRDLAQYLMGRIYLGQQDGDRAEKALLKVKPGGAFAPSQEELDYRLVQAAELLKDSKKWSAYLEKALAGAKTQSRKAPYLQQLGLLHARYGNADKAVEYLRKSLAGCGPTPASGAAPEAGTGDPESAETRLCSESRLRLADAEFRKKDWKAALGDYREFTARYPDHTESAWVHYQIANIHKATNNFESALNEYKRVIDNYPDSYWAGQARWKREDTIWRKEYEEVLD